MEYTEITSLKGKGYAKLERKFKVIKGGLDINGNKPKIFVDAYVTDTRLMGVVGLYVKWKIEEDNFDSIMQQFFYFDAEEYGLETYKCVMGENEEEVQGTEEALFGGLGGQRVHIDEKEAKWLVQYYNKFNKENNILPLENHIEFEFMLRPEISLTDHEKKDLMHKLCDPIVSDFQLINYYLMRSFGKDKEAANFLRKEPTEEDAYANFKMATFCKNTIDEDFVPAEEDAEKTFTCESLIESQDAYNIVISEVKTQGLKIVSCRQCSAFEVSAAEATMMLARPEFVTVYEILSENESFIDDCIGEMVDSAMITVHPNGRLILAFNKDNSHVNRKVFRLNEDVYGLYYISNTGQLILASYDIEKIMRMELRLRKNPLSDFSAVSAKYEFKEPVVYDFVRSDFEDFDEFVKFIMD